MDNEFFILFINKADYSLRFPYDVELERLSNYDIAIHYYKENILDTWGKIRPLIPIIITNNENLYLQYRHILSEKDYELFCRDMLPGFKGMVGDYGMEVWSHFINIKSGLYNKAYQSRTTETWNEEKTGNSYEFETDEGWTTSNEMINSLVIAKHIEEGNKS